MDRGAWKAAVHGVAEGRTQLSDFTFTFQTPVLNSIDLKAQRTSQMSGERNPSH